MIGGIYTEYKTSLFCEIDKYAAESYCAIHGIDKSLNIGDITKVDESSVQDFNVMFGGSPCTDFSVAGKQSGAVWTCKKCGYTYNPLEAHYSMRHVCPKCESLEIEKTRSSLLVEWLRFLREKKPRFAIYENVKNIVGAKFKYTFDLFIKEIEEYGYNVYWKVLNAKNYGIPQNRERVYCVIIRKDLDNGNFEFPDSIPLTHCLSDLLEDDVDEKYYLKNAKVTEMVEPIAPPQQCKIGIKLSNKGTVFEGCCDIASTLLARDYKGFGNQPMTAVAEIERVNEDESCM